MAQIRRDLTKGSISANLARFAFPVFLSCLLQALYGNADAIIVGQYSDLANIAGVTQGSQLTNILTQMISGLSTGASVIIAQYSGSGQMKKTEKAIRTVFTLFMASALALTGLMLVLNRPLAALLKVNDRALKPFLEYVGICELGLLFVFMYNCISAVLQALGDSRHPLVFVGIASTLNIFLDLFMVGVLKMGARGAALATVLAQMVSVLLSVRFLKKNKFSFDFSLKSLGIDAKEARLIFSLGLPYMIQRLLVYSSYLAISGLANPYGLVAGSAAGVVSKINGFATIPFSAFTVSISTVAAQNIGSGSMKRAQQTLYTGFIMSFAFGLLLFVLVQLFPRSIISIFSSDPSLVDIAAPFLCYYSVEYLLMPFTWSMHGFFTATGHTLIPSIDGIIAAVVCRAPFALLFSRTLGMGLNGIALGSALAVGGAIIPAFIFLFSGIWRKPKIKLDATGDCDES